MNIHIYVMYIDGSIKSQVSRMERILPQTLPLPRKDIGKLVFASVLTFAAMWMTWKLMCSMGFLSGMKAMALRIPVKLSPLTF